jgi:RNA polymerase sigma-70 factor (ECF subfamily)
MRTKGRQAGLAGIGPFLTRVEQGRQPAINEHVMTPPTAIASGLQPRPRRRKIDWGAALGEHDRWLRSIVHARLDEPGAVDDVMQEVAVAAVRQAAPIHDSSKVAPWLYRLAIRQALLYRRRMGRARNLTRRYADRFQPTDDDGGRESPLKWLLLRERRHAVQAALATLRPVDAEVLLLKYAQNWNYHQIAAHMEISHSAVEARLHRARARLRRALTRSQPAEEPK